MGITSIGDRGENGNGLHAQHPARLRPEAPPGAVPAPTGTSGLIVASAGPARNGVAPSDPETTLRSPDGPPRGPRRPGGDGGQASPRQPAPV